MRVGFRLMTVAVDWSLRVVAVVMQPLLHFDLVTRSQGKCLGAIFLTLLAASITLFWFVDQPTPLLSDDDADARPYLK